MESSPPPLSRARNEMIGYESPPGMLHYVTKYQTLGKSFCPSYHCNLIMGWLVCGNATYPSNSCSFTPSLRWARIGPRRKPPLVLHSSNLDHRLACRMCSHINSLVHLRHYSSAPSDLTQSHLPFWGSCTRAIRPFIFPPKQKR